MRAQHRPGLALRGGMQRGRPQHVNAGAYLITFYKPAGVDPELHVFSVDDLLAQKNAHVPAWLPRELALRPRPR